MTKRNFDKEMRAYALKNAIDHFKASEGKVLTKLFQHGLDKKDIGKIMPKIIDVVKDVNKMSKTKREEEIKKYSEYFVEKAEAVRDLPVLPQLEETKKPVFRLAPFPNGSLHLGNLKTFLLNAMYAEKYNGKILLVMDDTIGSEQKPVQKEAYDLIDEGLKWAGVKVDEIIFKSDRLNLYYKYGEELIRKGAAYVCECSQEEFQKLKQARKASKFRQQSMEENLNAWKKMHDDKTPAGSMVMRIKTDMAHKNPAFRDRVLFKISERKHPRVGKSYRVWPTLEMSWAVDDHLLGITHIIRGNDLKMETEMENFIWDVFGWDERPEIIHTGLVKIDFADGGKISKSKSQKEVESGTYSGWDDPRTWSPQSFVKRGIRKESVRDFVKEIGLNKQDVTVPIEALYAINRKAIDEKSMRFSFVRNPVKLKVEGRPPIESADIPVHPDKDQKRNIPVGDVYVSEDDLKGERGKMIRLLHLYNIKVVRSSGDVQYYGIDVKKNMKKINWVSDYLKARVRMPDGSWIDGFADADVDKLIKGDMIQFERFGFCRYDGTGKFRNANVKEFWFSHK